MSEDKQIALTERINMEILSLRKMKPPRLPLTIGYTRPLELLVMCRGLLHNLPPDIAIPLEKSLKIEGDRLYPK